jgi:hypothetical protein
MQGEEAETVLKELAGMLKGKESLGMETSWLDCRCQC